MPFDMTVEKPDAWIICSESQDDVAIWPDQDGVASHWHLWESLVFDIPASIFSGTDNSLEMVSMKMEGMFAGIVVVEDDFDDLILLKYEGIGMRAVNFWVGGGAAGTEGGIQTWDLGTHVGYVVEEGTAAK